MKKIVIIGGGISGLSAGIYARQNGFETEIYKNILSQEENVQGGIEKDII